MLFVLVVAGGSVYNGFWSSLLLLSSSPRTTVVVSVDSALGACATHPVQQEVVSMMQSRQQLTVQE